MFREHRLSSALLGAAACALGVGCGPRPVPPGYAGDDIREFVSEHREELNKEIAVGSGPRLYELGWLAGCQNWPELNRVLRQRHEEIFAPAGVEDAEVGDRVVRLMSRTELRCLDLDLSRQREFSAGLRHIGPRRSHQALRRPR